MVESDQAESAKAITVLAERPRPVTDHELKRGSKHGWKVWTIVAGELTNFLNQDKLSPRRLHCDSTSEPQHFRAPDFGNAFLALQ